MMTNKNVRGSRTKLSKLLRLPVIAAQITGMLGVTMLQVQPVAARAPNAPNAGTITGRIFRDYNANGIRDTNEPGIGNVSVTAVTSGGVFAGTSNTAGIYTINVATGSEARVQAWGPRSRGRPWWWRP